MRQNVHQTFVNRKKGTTAPHRVFYLKKKILQCFIAFFSCHHHLSFWLLQWTSVRGGRVEAFPHSFPARKFPDFFKVGIVEESIRYQPSNQSELSNLNTQTLFWSFLINWSSWSSDVFVSKFILFGSLGASLNLIF